jgi:ATP-binding cassette subfamily F protein 3
MLTVQNLTYRISGRLILENAGCTVQAGQRVGVVGANGAGKSTLFKLITGELHADDGQITLSDRNTLGYVRQDVGDMEKPLLDVVLAADTERDALMKAVETEEDPYKMGEMFARLDEIDAYAAPARASAILAGLGFKEEHLSQPLKTFSGGWQMRVALAGALFRSPDVLLLDEPTNHLDLEAILWLEGYLASYPKTLLLISHDRELLNACVTHILHVDNKKITAYTGNYNRFERERAEKMMSQQKLHEKQMAMRAHMEAFVERFKAKASKAKQAQSRMKALEKMDVVDAVMADRSVKFIFPQPEELAPPAIVVNDTSLGYGGKVVLQGLNLRIDMDDRIALLGANGNGKSTLIKLLSGDLAPMQGEMLKANKLRIGYFAQHQTESLDVNETPYQALNRAMPGKREADVRAVLGKFGFSKPLTDNRIGTLSGGEKARLLFALMSLDAPHILLLDEPTNHLDMDAREALVQALNNYNGAVVMVSHDPSMIERVADSLWLVADGQCKPFDGDLEAYRNHIIAQRRAERRSNKGESKAAKPAAVPENPATSAERTKLEKHIAKLQGKREKLEAQMADADFYSADPAKIAKTQADHAALVNELTTTEEAWLALG